jgi:aspartyl-tRNA(Asn)/glutamyl-tRNA(Gln) amidotransferase subunit A
MTGSADDIAFQSAAGLRELIRSKALSPVELVRIYLDRIERFDQQLRAYITVCPDEALEAARRAEAAMARGGELGPLHGVPFAVKDQFDAQGVPTTVGSRILRDAVASEDATVVARLRAAGGILLGKLNLTEFALGGTRDFPYGQPRNPWNLDHDPGGSSSGSGIATAAALCAVSMGEDTGGSVRGPAAWCGVAGIRPTWGRVSRHGVFPLSWSMDAPGPLTRGVEDNALVMSVIAGRDERDRVSSRRPVPNYRAALTGNVRGIRIGLITELVRGADTSPEVRSAVEAAGDVLRRFGAVVEDVSLPLLPMAGAVFMALADSEGSGLHRRWLVSRPGDYDQATRRRLLTASLLPASVYHQAQRARALIREQILDACERHDVLMSPTAPTAAPPIAAGAAAIVSRAEVAGRFFTRRSYASPYSLAGTPALSVPCGFTSSGLPIGLQLAGRPFDESTLFRVGHAYEQATDWHRRRPLQSSGGRLADHPPACS